MKLGGNLREMVKPVKLVKLDIEFHTRLQLDQPQLRHLNTTDVNTLRVPDALAQLVATRRCGSTASVTFSMRWSANGRGEPSVFPNGVSTVRGSGRGRSGTAEPDGRGRHVHRQTTQCRQGKGARGRGRDGC